MSPLTDLIKNHPNANCFDLPPLPLDAEGMADDFRRYYAHTLGRDCDDQTIYYAYKALSITLRDRLVERWKNTRNAYDEADCKRTYYLSLEFLMGRALSNAMLNLGLNDAVAQGLYEMGLALEEIQDNEPDAGLGNGGLGRLAACFLDSCASLQLPVRGYGLRYEYGMFRQVIEGGEQHEEPDHWLRDGNPWELERPEFTQRIPFGGRTEASTDRFGRKSVRWIDTSDVLAVPYDVPVPGYRNDTVNTLRLWKAAATDEFNLDEFNAGSYPESVAQKNAAEHITMVLYPNDASECGEELRLRQQFFLASASIKDVLRDWIRRHGNDFTRFAERNCFQLNDTHPAVSVAELMRQLMDEHDLEWDAAWLIVRQTMAYTNHTLLPEALERWPVRLFRQLLPRILEIIFEINARFLAEVASRWPGDVDRQRRMSLIEEGYDPQVRMAYLAIVGSFSVNGVAALHSELLIDGLFRDFNELWPRKFNNKTNGVTQRRWLAMCNPGLRELLNETIGDGWVRDLSQLKQLEPFAADPAFRARWHAIKQENKQRLVEQVSQLCRVEFPLEAIFDVQVKRIHEYKRQLLNVLHVIHLYNRIKRGDTRNWTPRCVLIGGKAAPGYMMAKQIIKLINHVARTINGDPDTAGLLRMAFMPDYRVSLMEVIAPGTDLSEQISTAGKEASGTGNMKFMMNGAITIGTLDGANIEIREQVGDENFFLFGMTAAGVEARRQHYDPNGIIASDPALLEVMNLLESGHFNQFAGGAFDQVIFAIRNPHDPWMTAADFRNYIDVQEQAALAYRDRERWLRMSILNTARSGHFSSDRTITEYSRDIWHLDAVAPHTSA
ncbi:glycogen phosphorylase [Chromatium okenii]|uniref:glycogen/starch/alpha-glucan phosphorylase n=1 Tax=Chromatium okenii TaxID=61644 RepID=UPI0019050569|nr:glycogen/starch/alpha-glucan phosphorylase [Chromatium okenii]MBK1641111.1 glycogen phosphorylase [Chromatium okenii]